MQANNVRIENFPISKIDPLLDRRRNPKNIEGLAKSMKKIGLYEPALGVVAENGRCQLIYGHGRLRAAKLNGMKTLPVMLYDSYKNALEAYLAENWRLEQTKDDLAMLTKRAVDAGKTDTQIADMYSVTLQTVREYRSILERLAPELKQVVEEKSVPIQAVRRISRLKPDRQKTIAQLMKQELPDKAPQQEIRKLVLEIDEAERRGDNIKECLSKMREDAQTKSKEVRDVKRDVMRRWSCSAGGLLSLIKSHQKLLDNAGIDYKTFLSTVRR
jgi:ParB/RepB/Spo0J family partition protein